MDRILVLGAETVVGANLAAYVAAELTTSRVTAVSAVNGVTIPGCDMRSGSLQSHAAASFVEAADPTQVVLCGWGARSSWETRAEDLPADLAEQAAGWAAAAHDRGAGFTFISSDAVFTGPWMFHEEDSTGRCDSRPAAEIREAERRVREAHPQALVVRTNAFGWSPLGGSGWIEQSLSQLQSRRFADQDFVRHATPILATDLAGVLVRIWREQLPGVFHIAGAERVSPLRFVQRLAEQYELPWLSLCRRDALQERAVGFGAGECSLQTKRIRKAVCVAMPMLSEGLARLVEQDRSGYRARLCGSDPAVVRGAA